MQQAIARKEKAREAIEKKAKKIIKRAAAREEFAREKAARQAEKEVKKHKRRAKQSCAKLKLKRGA